MAKKKSVQWMLYESEQRQERAIIFRKRVTEQSISIRSLNEHRSKLDKMEEESMKKQKQQLKKKKKLLAKRTEGLQDIVRWKQSLSLNLKHFRAIRRQLENFLAGRRYLSDLANLKNRKADETLSESFGYTACISWKSKTNIAKKMVFNMKYRCNSLRKSFHACVATTNTCHVQCFAIASMLSRRIVWVL